MVRDGLYLFDARVLESNQSIQALEYCFCSSQRQPLFAADVLSAGAREVNKYAFEKPGHWSNFLTGHFDTVDEEIKELESDLPSHSKKLETWIVDRVRCQQPTRIVTVRPSGYHCVTFEVCRRGSFRACARSPMRMILPS